MYEDSYDLNDLEKQDLHEVLSEMSLRGGRLTDAAGRPIAYRVLRGRRFLVCDKGIVWRYAPAGSLKDPGRPGSTPRRNSAVEMWTGRWRKAVDPQGKATYAKCLVWVPLDDNINGHPGISKLGWYRSQKGFRHPLDEPHAPTDDEIAALEGRRAAAADAVFARMEAEGLNVPDAPAEAEPRRAGAAKAPRENAS